MTTQLAVYLFPPGAPFEGWLVSAFERLEVDGPDRVVDALFVRAEHPDGEAMVFDGRGDDLSTMLVRLIDFRLDAAARAQSTAEALAGRAGDGHAGVPAETVRQLLDALEPGAALAAVLLEHATGEGAGRESLDDALARAHGWQVVAEPVETRRLAEAAALLRAAAARPARTTSR